MTILKKTASLFAQQAAVLQAIEDEVARRGATIVTPYFVLNPFGTAPLTGLLCFNTQHDTQYVVSTLGRDHHADLSYLSPRTRTHRLPIIGLFAGTVTQISLREANHDALLFDVSTDPLPPMVPTMQQEGHGPFNELQFFLPADGSSLPAAYDANGECRWYSTAPMSHRLRLAANGHILVGGGINLAPPYGNTSLWEMDLLGRLVCEYRLPVGFNSDFVELSDGALVAITHDPSRGTVGDVLVKLDRSSGQVLARLSLHEVLPLCCGSAHQSGSDWFHGATLTYDAEAHTVTLCGLEQSIVLQIDAATLDVLQIFADRDAWQVGGADTSRFVTMPPDTLWPDEPYGALWQEDRLIYLSGNRHLHKKRSTPRPITVHAVDLRTGAQEQLLSEHTLPISPILNDIAVDDSFFIVHAGGCGIMPDGSQPKQPGVFHLLQHPETLCTTERHIYDGNRRTVHQTVSVNTYPSTSLRVPQLRPVREEEVRGVLGRWAEEAMVDIVLPVADTAPVPEDMHLQLHCDDSRLYLTAQFIQGDASVLVLRQGDTWRQYYIQSNRKPYGADWLKTYIGGPERPVQWAIALDDVPPGTWEVCVLVDETLYTCDTSLVLE